MDRRVRLGAAFVIGSYLFGAGASFLMWLFFGLPADPYILALIVFSWPVHLYGAITRVTLWHTGIAFAGGVVTMLGAAGWFE